MVRQSERQEGRQAATPPRFHGPAFSCPSCGDHARHTWDHFGGSEELGWLEVSRCSHCGHRMLWRGVISSTLRFSGEVIHPVPTAGPPAPDFLSGTHLRDYEEARRIALRAPRAAAALLRQVLGELCRNAIDTRTDARRPEPGRHAATDIPSDIAAVLARIEGGPADDHAAGDPQRFVESLFECVVSLSARLAAVGNATGRAEAPLH